MANGNVQEARSLFDRWVSKTEDILLDQLSEKKIGITEDLRNSLRSEIVNVGDGFMVGRFYFLQRGRFVDMGAGRGSESNSRGEGLKVGRKARRAKPWYSKPFYGRLNALQGAIGAQLSEQVISNIKGALKSVT